MVEHCDHKKISCDLDLGRAGEFSSDPMLGLNSSLNCVIGKDLANVKTCFKRPKQDGSKIFFDRSRRYSKHPKVAI